MLWCKFFSYDYELSVTVAYYQECRTSSGAANISRASREPTMLWSQHGRWCVPHRAALILNNDGKAQCVPMPWQKSAHSLKPNFWLWLDRSVAFVFHCAVHTMCGWVCCSGTCLRNSPIPSTVPDIQKGTPCSLFLLMLPVDKRYASVIHLRYELWS